MNNRKSEISIIGFGTVSSITSLILADKLIQNDFYIKKNKSLLLELKPLSNPIVNGPTRNIEAKFISNEYLNAIPYIRNYQSISYDENFKKYRVISGEYETETYSIDNRIRLHCFLQEIKKSPLINLVEFDDFNDVVSNLNSNVNILGNGSYKSIFRDIEKFALQKQIKERELFFFNLVCEKSTYNKYSGKVNIHYISDIGEILIYPFLHHTNKQTLNLTINVIKGSKWDVFSKFNSSLLAFNLLKEILLEYIPELAKDIMECCLAEEYFKLFKTEPYYKEAKAFYKNKLFFGIGESISKSDPLIGQGYNSGVDLSLKIIDLIQMGSDSNIIDKKYSEYSQKILEYLYHINIASTQVSENKYLNCIYDIAVNNKNLRDLLFSTFNNISNYFPWLINEEETKKMIVKYKLI